MLIARHIFGNVFPGSSSVLLTLDAFVTFKSNHRQNP